MPDSYYPEQIQAMTMIVALLYHHAEYLRGGPYYSAFPSLLCYDSWIHYPDTTQWLGWKSQSKYSTETWSEVRSYRLL